MNYYWFVLICVCALIENFVLKEPEEGVLMTFCCPLHPLEGAWPVFVTLHEHRRDFIEKLFSFNGPFYPMKSILCNLLKNFKDPHKVLPWGLSADLHNPFHLSFFRLANL